MINKFTKKLLQLAITVGLIANAFHTKAQLNLQAGWAITASPYDDIGYGMCFDQGGYGTYIGSATSNNIGTATEAIVRGLDYNTGWNFTKTFGSNGANNKVSFVKSYITGGSEKIISIGEFVGTIDMGGGGVFGQTFSSPTGNGIFLTSNLRSNTQNYWLTSIIPTNSNGSVTLTDVYDDQNGFLYLTGTIENNVSFSGTVVNGGQHKGIWFAKYSTAGALQWAKAISSPNLWYLGYTPFTLGGAICSDGSGNVYVSATLCNDINWDVDPNAGVADISLDNLPSYGNNMFIGKYSSTGALLDYITYGGTNVFLSTVPRITKMRVSGNQLIAAGNSNQGGQNFNPKGTPMSYTATADVIFLAAYNTTNLNCNWLQPAIGTSAGQVRVNDIAIATDSAIYIAGYLGNSITFPGLAVNNSQGGRDMFVTRYFKSGAPSFCSNWGGPGDDGVNSMLLGNNLVYINGYASQNFNFNPGISPTIWPGQGGYDWVSAVYSQTYGSAPLAMTWQSFSAQLNEANETELYWQTSDEVNTDRYIVERSLDGQNWEPIETIKSNNQLALNEYATKDADILQGQIYYRIKQINIDGTYTYSKIEQVYKQAKISFNIYPNPCMNTLNITKSDLKTKSKLEIFDALGRLIISEELNDLNNTIDVANLNTGLYSVRILSGTQTYTTSIIKN